MKTTAARTRLRDLGIQIGRYPTGKHNAITDVPGVLVGHQTVIQDEPSMVRSGVTAIIARDGHIHEDFAFAGFFSFNGVGEMTGLPLLEEWGVLTSPILLTNTHQVGMAWDTLSQYGTETFGGFAYKLPVVAETYDGYLNGGSTFPLTPDDVRAALRSASAGPVAEGNVGGGTGMISYDFKGGIGTSSRRVEVEGQEYTLGALVQANHGARHTLRVDGVPVGLELGYERVPAPGVPGVDAPPDSRPFLVDPPASSPPESPEPFERESSSILVVLATDAPLLPGQCKRLARRATVGLARTGGLGLNSSGDLFLAFATGNHYPSAYKARFDLQMLHHSAMNVLIEASAEVVEEAILNALCAAETLAGFEQRTVHALPLDSLAEVMRKYGRGAS